MDFWRRQDNPQTKFPTWVEYSKKFIIANPSSACIERVWSIFSNFFGDEDVQSLIDYINVVLMCKYNYRSKNNDSECLQEDEAKRNRRRRVGLYA